MSKYKSRKNVLIWRLKDFGFCKSLAFAVFISINLSSFAQTTLSIGQIQGTGLFSPYTGENVVIPEAVITYRSSFGLIAQSTENADDQNPLTSEGIWIDFNPPSWATRGKTIRINGRVAESNGATIISGSNVSIEELSTAAYIKEENLDLRLANFDYSTIDDLETLEWMEFQFDEAKVCGPTFGNSDWIHVYFGDERPKREPGIPAPGISGYPVFDNNLENFSFLYSNQPLPDLSAHSIITGRGILLPDNERYELLGLNYQASIADVYSPVVNVDEEQLSIATANLLRLDIDFSNFNLRLPKIVNYLIEGLGAPHIIGVQEVANLPTLQALANAMNAAQTAKRYSAYLLQGNNSTSINSGYLVSGRIDVIEVSALGKSQSLSIGGALHDRPPLLLKAKTYTDPQIEFSILNLHIRSLSGIEGNDSFFVRTKRNEQAISVAQMIQSLRDQNLFVIGDYNAYPFSDGYVDIYNQLAGGESEGALFANEDIVNPPLRSAVEENDEDEKYSFVFQGNTQQIDHILFNDLADIEFERSHFYRGNADAPEAWENDYNRPERASDHDGIVAYFSLPYPWGIVVEDPGEPRPFVTRSNPYTQANPLRFHPLNGDIYDVNLYDFSGKKMRTWKTDFIDEDDIWEMPQEFNLIEGLYILEIIGGDFQWTDVIFFSNNQ